MTENEKLTKVKEIIGILQRNRENREKDKSNNQTKN